MLDNDYSADFLSQQRAANGIRKDIATARGLIADCLARYKKKMLHARSKKQAEDLSMFAELADYNRKEEIQEAFGWDFITEKQMEHLNDLWDARENVIANKGRYADRVTQILESAMANCGDVFADTLEEYDGLVRRDNEDRIRIERENRENSYKRYIAGL